MGQRLNLEIYTQKDGNTPILANIYYHWSAYSTSALNEMKAVLNALSNNLDERSKLNNDALWVAHSLCKENAISGLCEDSFETAQQSKVEGLVIRKATDRNEGMLSITPSDIASTELWGEYTAKIIILEDNTFEFVYDVFHRYDNEEAFREDYGELPENTPLAIFSPAETLPIDDTMDLEEFHALCALIENVISDKNTYYFKFEGSGEVFTLVE